MAGKTTKLVCRLKGPTITHRDAPFSSAPATAVASSNVASARTTQPLHRGALRPRNASQAIAPTAKAAALMIGYRDGAPAAIR